MNTRSQQSASAQATAHTARRALHGNVHRQRADRTHAQRVLDDLEAGVMPSPADIAHLRVCVGTPAPLPTVSRRSRNKRDPNADYMIVRWQMPPTTAKRIFTHEGVCTECEKAFTVKSGSSRPPSQCSDKCKAEYTRRYDRERKRRQRRKS